MEMLSGAQMVVRALEDQGVEHVFGYPGGSVLDIYDALFENGKMEHVPVRHEQAAVHMADGYARSTGKVGTVLVTSGPGATNLLTAAALAHVNRLPVLLLPVLLGASRRLHPAGAAALTAALVVAMGAVHVLVRDFFVGGGADVHHFQFKAQGHAGQWVVTVQDYLVVGDVGHGEDHGFVVGAFGGLAQKDIQRLLAYSSIANIGYALLGIAAGTAEGLQAMLMFMTLYVIDQLGFFAILLSLSKSGRPIRRIADLAGLKKDRPLTAVALTILSLSVLGMPPFSGFWGKYYVFGAAADAGLWPVAAAGLVASVVAAFYYLRIIKLMWFDAPVDDIATDAAPVEAKWIGWACAAFAFPLVIIGLTWLEPLTKAASAGFGNG